MKMIHPILLLVAFFVCPVSPPALAATVQEIERLPFEEAYRLWLQERAAVVPNLPVMPSGATDPKTGKFTPATFWALTCRLGRDAHIQESFLVSALTTNEWVSMILETSARLCSRFGIESQAAVLFDPEHGYRSPMRDFVLGPKERRSLWLKAMKKSNSQPSGAANGSLPFRSETNPTSSAAGSRR
jgi:hypothetical protein